MSDPFSSITVVSQPLPSDHRRRHIPSGYAGTAATIDAMRQMVEHGKRDNRIKQLAIRLISGCGEKEYECFARSVFDYIRSLRYVLDPVGVEAVATPWQIIQNRGGDCDDFAILGCALLESMGLPCEFVTIKGNPKSSEFTHVYFRTKVGSQFIALDCTMAEPFGWEPPEKYPRQTWPASADSSVYLKTDTRDMAGFGCAECRKGLGCPECGGTCGQAGLNGFWL